MKDNRDPNELGQRLLAIKKVNPSLKLSEIADGEGVSWRAGLADYTPVSGNSCVNLGLGSNGRVLS